MAQRKFPDWATTDVPDVGDGSPNKIDPGGAKQALGWAIEKPLLQTMNWLQNLFSHFIRANNEFKIRTNGYEAEAGEIVLMDNTSSTPTGFLPANPVDRQWVMFGGVTSFFTNAVFVDGNGIDIMNSGTTGVELNINYYMFIFVYSASDNLWEIKLGSQQGRV